MRLRVNVRRAPRGRQRSLMKGAAVLVGIVLAATAVSDAGATGTPNHTKPKPGSPKPGATVTVVEKRRQARDHPVVLGVPETFYLKCFVLRKLS